jgi:hypothetical protein
MKLTMFTPIGLDTIGKTFSWDGQSLVKDGPLFPSATRASQVELDDLAGVYRWLNDNSAANYCVTYGVPKGSGPWYCLPDFAVSDERYARQLIEGLEPRPLISRTNSCLAYGPGTHLVSVDYDPPVDPHTGALLPGHPWSAAQVWDVLVQVEPMLADVGHIEMPFSSSSNLVDGNGRVIQGAGGCRVFFCADLSHSKGPKDLMQALFDRMLAVGLCWPFMDSTGRVSLRTCIDMALYKPSQPDFLGAPKLTGLARKVQSIVHAPGGVLDASRVSALAGRDRLAGLARLREARLALHDLSAERREDWHRANDERAAERNPGVDLASARRRRNALLDGAARSMLPADYLIHVDRIGWVSVAEIVADEGRFAGRSTSSPIEPDYPVGNGQPQPGRGKITRRGAHLVVIDYAHGSFAQYVLSGSNAEFDALVAESTGAQARVAEAQQEVAVRAQRQGDRLPEPVHLDDLVSQQEAALPVVEAPRARRFAVTPVVPAERFAIEADRALARRGITVLTGLDLQRSVIDKWLRQPGKRLAIGVPSYQDALSLRDMALQANPKARVMIMPGRSTDESAQRKRHGQDVFQYIDTLTGEKAGLSDTLCEKKSLVRKLMGVGQRTAAPLTCIRVRPGAEPERCPHIEHCGYVKRLNARQMADFIIYVNSTLQGEDHPLLGPVLSDLVSSSLILDPVQRASSDLWHWSEQTWRRVPVLGQVLDLAAAAQGYRPDSGVPSKQIALDAEVWAGDLSQISPRTDAVAGMRIVEQYRLDAQQKVEPDEPLPTVVLTVIDAWLKKEAHLKVVGGRVYATVREPLRRLAGTSAILATSPSPTMTIAAGRVGAVQIGIEAAVDPVVGTVELDLPAASGSAVVRPMLAMRSSQTMLPSKVLQVGEDTLATWLRRGDGTEGKRHARDVVHLAKLLKESGPGIVLSDFPEEIGELFAKFGEDQGVTFLRFFECSTALFLGPKAPKAARWAMVIGRANPMTGQALSRAAMDSSEKPELNGVLRARVKPRFGFRDGVFRPAPLWMGGDQAWRHAGATAALDELLMAGVIAPVALVAGWLASQEQADQLPRMLVVCSQFPLASERQASAGVLIDDLQDWTVVPPASQVLKKVASFGEAEIWKRLELTEEEIAEELEAEKDRAQKGSVAQGGDMFEYWNRALRGQR